MPPTFFLLLALLHTHAFEVPKTPIPLPSYGLLVQTCSLLIFPEGGDFYIWFAKTDAITHMTCLLASKVCCNLTSVAVYSAFFVFLSLSLFNVFFSIGISGGSKFKIY